MSVKFDVTKRIEWLKKRITISELDEEYIRLQIMEAMMEALEKGQSLPIDSVVESPNEAFDRGFTAGLNTGTKLVG